MVVRVPADLDTDQVDAWARTRCPDRFEPSLTGTYFDEAAAVQRRPTLALVEVLIAHLVTVLATSGRTD